MEIEEKPKIKYSISPDKYLIDRKDENRYTEQLLNCGHISNFRSELAN